MNGRIAGGRGIIQLKQNLRPVSNLFISFNSKIPTPIIAVVIPANIIVSSRSGMRRSANKAVTAAPHTVALVPCRTISSIVKSHK